MVIPCMWFVCNQAACCRCFVAMNVWVFAAMLSPTVPPKSFACVSHILLKHTHVSCIDAVVDNGSGSRCAASARCFTSVDTFSTSKHYQPDDAESLGSLYVTSLCNLQQKSCIACVGSLLRLIHSKSRDILQVWALHAAVSADCACRWLKRGKQVPLHWMAGWWYRQQDARRAYLRKVVGQ